LPRYLSKDGGKLILNVTASEFMDMSIPLPSLEEQRRIASVLNTCDEELRLLRAQVDALKRQKQGLMQKLLSGEVPTLRRR
jgi:type I restriction enzyme S subunit